MDLLNWIHKDSRYKRFGNSYLLVCVSLWAALLFGCYRYAILPEQCKLIEKLPYDISSVGCYELSSDVHYSDENGTALIIRSNHVRLNLGGNHITGSDTSSLSVGISVRGGHDVLVENGRLSGFLYGIRVEPDGEAGSTLRFSMKDVELTDNFLRGAMISGKDTHLENIVVKNTGSRIVFPDAYVVGLELSGENCEVSRSSVFNTYSSGNGSATAIVLSGNVDGCKLEKNTLTNTDGLLKKGGAVGFATQKSRGNFHLENNVINGFSNPLLK